MPEIPRILHQLWIGPDDGAPPPLLDSFARSWRDKHPQWDYRLWTRTELGTSRFNPDLEEFVLGHYSYPESHSLLPCIHRYEILVRHGGVFVEMDWECVKPIDDLMEGATCFVAMELERTAEKERMVYDGIIGSTRGHPAMWEVLNRMSGYFLRNWKKGWWHSLGPPMLTSVVIDREDVTKLPRFIFEDVRAAEWHPDLKRFLPDTVYAWHHSDWKERSGFSRGAVEPASPAY